MIGTGPNCPMCGNNKHSGPFDGNLFRCAIHGIHDGKPDEGGSAYNDPTKRIEIEERIRERKREQRQPVKRFKNY